MASKIFISYSRKDMGAVMKLRDEIDRCTGVCPWMDVTGIETGAQFADVIARNIDSCELLVFVISNNSVKSSWTRKEVLYAQERRKKIYPVVIDDAQLPRQLAFLFVDVDRVDLRDAIQKKKFFSDLDAFLTAHRPESTILTRNRRSSTTLSSRRVQRETNGFASSTIEDEYSQCRWYQRFWEKYNSCLISLTVIILVIIFVGVPVYILTSRIIGE